MSTVEDLGKKVKAKFPGQYDDLSDVDLGTKVKAKFPDAYKDFADKKTPLFGLSKVAAARKASIGVEQTKAGYEQDISAAKSKFVGDVAKTIPVAATLATGGLAAPLAFGAMALAGGASGVYEETAKLALGAEDAATSPKQLARRLGVDAALSAGAQGAGTIAGKLLSVAGKSVLEPMVARAAAKADTGKTILGTYGGKLLNQLRSADAAAGAPKISIQRELDDLEASVALRKTGTSDAFNSLWGGKTGGEGVLAPGEGGVAQKIHAWSMNDGTASGLAEIKGELSQAAYKRPNLNHEERTALKAFVEKLDQKLTNQFDKIGAKDTYAGYKETVNQLHRFNAASDVANLALRHMAWRAGYLVAGAGAVGGGGYGYQHGGVGGALAGAVAGATAITAASAAIQKGAPFLLEKMLADKTAAPLANRAINSMMTGDTKGAVAIMSRAAAQVGAKDLLASYFKDNAEKEAPDAAANRQEQSSQGR